MCGIAGIAFSQSEPETLGQRVRQMTDAIRHRGPDDAGLHVAAIESRVGPKRPYRVALGHRRLSILDLSPAGHQPMSSDDGRYHIVFNGEIYNYVELRSALSSLRPLRSNSDTEILLRLYEEQGIAMLSELRGMFAFAVFDHREETLVLARDPVGKKPLFYAVTPDGVVFASELKALFSAGVERSVDPAAVDDFFHFGYVPAPRTLVRGVRSLPPGTFVRFAPGQLDAVPQEFWSPRPTQNGAGPRRARSEEDLLDELDALIRDAVKIRLRSDVPLGAFLSGGIDSSLIVSYLAELSSTPVNTFCIGFGENAHDERKYAAEVANLFQTTHRELLLEPRALPEVLPRLAWHFDDGLSDSAAIPTWYLSEMTREHVTVALSGDGGDELFGGYSTYAGEKFARMWQVLPRSARDASASLAGAVAEHAPQRELAHRAAYAHKILNESSLAPIDRYLSKRSVFSVVERDSLFQEQVLPRLARPWHCPLVESLFDAARFADPITLLTYVDTRFYLPFCMFVKVDRTSMAHSLEVRVPLVDTKVVEFSFGLGPEMKLRGWRRKYLLRKLAERRLPRSITERPKHGFTVPLSAWFKSGDSAGLIETLLLSPETRCTKWLFRSDTVRRWCDEQRRDRRELSPRLWMLMVFEQWLRTHEIT
jgi:asparagine synthase (glutamine-hydrolysing)